jgi:hypothetical protein
MSRNGTAVRDPAVGLRAKREARGMTREELSLRAGIPVDTLSALEAGWERAWSREDRETDAGARRQMG